MAQSIASCRPRREIRLVFVLSIILVCTSLWMLVNDSDLISASSVSSQSATGGVLPFDSPTSNSVGFEPMADEDSAESSSRPDSWLGWDLAASNGLRAFPSSSMVRRAYYSEPEQASEYNAAVRAWSEFSESRYQTYGETARPQGELQDLEPGSEEELSLLLPPPSPEEARQQIIIDIADLRARTGGGISASLPSAPAIGEDEVAGNTAWSPSNSEENPEEQFDDALERVVRSRTDQVMLDPRGIVIFRSQEPDRGHRPDFVPAPEPSRLENEAPPFDAEVVRHLRETSRLVDERAAAAEDLEQYELADRLRNLADHLRAEARMLSGGSARIGRRYDARWAY